MSEKTVENLSEVSKTLMIPLYARAVESQRPDGMIKDPRAVEIVRQMNVDFSRFQLQAHDVVAIIMRMREFDRQTREFLVRCPDGVVVHIGCGLDTRFERVDNGQVEWFDLDLPEVIDLRKKRIGGEGSRYHLLSGSALCDEWLIGVSPYSNRPFLFIAEGVLPYFEEGQVKTLVLMLQERFPGAELVCDAQTPFLIWADNLQLAVAGLNARLHWGLKRSADVQSWGEGIAMLGEWFYFDQSEPRMNAFRWMRRIPLLAKSTGIFHYRLGLRP